MKIIFILFILLYTVAFSSLAQRTKRTLLHGNDKLVYALTLPDDFEKTTSYPLLLLPGEVDEPNIYIEGEKSNHGWVIVESPINIKSPNLFQPLINQIKREVKISTITILGFSANSIGAFNIAALYPKLVNNVVGMPGHPKSVTNLTKFQNMSILFIVGEKDTYWLKEAKRYYQLLEKQKIKTKLEIIEGGGHILHEVNNHHLRWWLL